MDVRAGSGDDGDQWSRWLLRDRHGGDPGGRERTEAFLGPIRDRVLDAAAIRPGETVLDVGAGDGLLGLAAARRVGPTGRVVFSDVSAPLLEHCRGRAAELGLLDRCAFVRTGLPDLTGLADGSADVVVLRSVLIYVGDLFGALAALHRVLRPGGRLSLFEPVNRFADPEPAGRLWSLDVAGLEPLAAKVRAEVRRHRPPDDPLLRFDERRLLTAVEAAGFGTATLDYSARFGDRGSVPAPDPAAFLASAANPTMPTYGELLAAALEPAERAMLVERLAGELRAGRGWSRDAVCYLSARRG